MTKDQAEAWFSQDEELTRALITVVDRRRPEFSALRAKIDRIRIQRWTLPSWKRERLTEEEVSFLLHRNPGRRIPGV